MTTPTPTGPYKPVLILHGGAGSITRASLPPTLYQAYHTSLLSYVTSTHDLLARNGSAIDAACHAATLMEDDPLFNCGRGSVFNLRGEIEMEASIAVTCVHDGVEYEGMVKRSAAVSMVRRTRHPILLARMVLGMGDGDGNGNGGFGGTAQMHGHLSGREVEMAGWRAGLERKGKGWFWTRRRWGEHRRGLKGPSSGGHGEKCTDHSRSQDTDTDASSGDESEDDEEHETQGPAGIEHILELPSQGTVGAVCMDSFGVIAVATSTGGLTNKRPGRIGDTPTVGAGFWAESWIEQIKQSQREAITRPEPGPSISKKLATAMKSEFDFWLGDCLTSTAGREDVARDREEKHIDKQPLIPSDLHTNTRTIVRSSISRKAVAMSGTGNGDSFLRTNACRTAAAISRFSLPQNTVSLAGAIHAIAGPGGELQNSAGDRWGKTGEGEGGIIGIEITSDGNGGGGGKAVFDFNCGGMWRAYFEREEDGVEWPRVMVFQEEY